MFSLFSLSGSMGVSGPRPIDLELLSDAELLHIWDQTQNLINSLEDKEMPTHISQYYSFVIETELQSRAQREPSSLFQLVKNSLKDCEEDSNIENKFPFPTPILAKNIII